MKLNGFEITGVTDDTREVKEGFAFVAVKGRNFDGESAAASMLGKGAAVVITEKDLNLGARQVLVENVRLAYAETAKRFYGNPTDKLKLIAVTGTNGKSTVTALIKGILEKLGHKTAAIGTIGYDTCDGAGIIKEARLTLPRQSELYALFAEAVKNGAEYCVIEASSQALAQSRLAEERFKAGIFTNLTQDHLDYHGTMEKYYRAKKSLFNMCEKAIVCIDNKYGQRLAEELEKEKVCGVGGVVTCSINDIADYSCVNVKTGSGGVSYWLSVRAEEKSYPVKSGMPGLFNVANSAEAIAACNALGFDTADCVNALVTAGGVRGRSEIIYSGDFTVVCDYAHTEDALIKILTSFREFAKRRVICLFGAAGERDAEKRALMGKSAAELSDYVVITSDNPRFENPQAIIGQVEAGVKKRGVPYKTFVDRREAIIHALNEAEKDDIVLLCGKGHETYQVIGDDYQPFDEKEIVKEFFNEHLG